MVIIAEMKMKYLLAVLTISLLIHSAFLIAETPKKDADFAVREQMIAISRQLGVTCAYCHNLKNFKSDEKKNFKTARKHIEVLNWLNTKGFAGTPKVDCFLCHRGKAVPDYREPQGL